ncbi:MULTISPECIES: nitroreductase family protein [unclassified Streptomyces]|uniref:nitroreductase family protein n=1 Tax=unclassified Streptomyces TaxID=2593676 RepID=UPI00278BE849|nr:MULTISPECIES: nitroreductase family protein [unclassified Streptomyces]
MSAAVPDSPTPRSLPTAREMLTTTRSVRKRLDWDRAVDTASVERALDTALQAPNGSNNQLWQWILVTDPALRAALADCYREAAGPYLTAMREAADGDARRRRLWEASAHLADNLHRAPVLVVPCLAVGPEDFEARFTDLGFPDPVGHAAHSVYYGSIWPAIWSLMLALRLENLVSAVTTLHLGREADAARVLGLPDTVRQAGLLAVAHPTGHGFRPAPRRPAAEVTHHDTWRS